MYTFKKGDRVRVTWTADSGERCSSVGVAIGDHDDDDVMVVQWSGGHMSGHQSVLYAEDDTVELLAREAEAQEGGAR